MKKQRYLKDYKSNEYIKYQKGFTKRQKYNRRILQMRYQISQLLIALKPIDQQIDNARAKAITPHLIWFSADYAIPHLLFDAYRYVHSNDHIDSESKRLVKLINLRNTDDIMDPHCDNNAIILESNLIMNLLWENPSVRHLFNIWLQFFTKMKTNYGYEWIDDMTFKLHQINKLIQLNRGVTTGNVIKLPQYKNMSKQTLTKDQWQKAIQSNLSWLNACWD